MVVVVAFEGSANQNFFMANRADFSLDRGFWLVFSLKPYGFILNFGLIQILDFRFLKVFLCLLLDLGLHILDREVFDELLPHLKNLRLDPLHFLTQVINFLINHL